MGALVITHQFRLKRRKNTTQKLYKWESKPVFNGQKLSGYVWAASAESALRKVKTYKTSPCNGVTNADPTVSITIPPTGIYYAIGYNQKKKTDQPKCPICGAFLTLPWLHWNLPPWSPFCMG
jgi:hypothetical protein